MSSLYSIVYLSSTIYMSYLFAINEINVNDLIIILISFILVIVFVYLLDIKQYIIFCNNIPAGHKFKIHKFKFSSIITNNIFICTKCNSCIILNPFHTYNKIYKLKDRYRFPRNYLMECDLEIMKSALE